MKRIIIVLLSIVVIALSCQNPVSKTASATAVVAVTDVTLSKTSASISAGGTLTLTATVTPSNATDQTLVWSTDDSTVATVSGGVITAVSSGVASIHATATNGTYGYCVVLVPTTLTTPTTPTTPTTHAIVYTVTGTASTVDLTIENESGGTSQYSDKALPWTYSFTVDSKYHFLYVAAQNQGSTGSVTASISIDGTVKKTSTSEGEYVIAEADMTIGNL